MDGLLLTLASREMGCSRGLQELGTKVSTMILTGSLGRASHVHDLAAPGIQYRTKGLIAT